LRWDSQVQAQQFPVAAVRFDKPHGASWWYHRNPAETGHILALLASYLNEPSASLVGRNKLTHAGATMLSPRTHQGLENQPVLPNRLFPSDRLQN